MFLSFYLVLAELFSLLVIPEWYFCLFTWSGHGPVGVVNALYRTAVFGGQERHRILGGWFCAAFSAGEVDAQRSWPDQIWRVKWWCSSACLTSSSVAQAFPSFKQNQILFFLLFFFPLCPSVFWDSSLYDSQVQSHAFRIMLSQLTKASFQHHPQIYFQP